MVAFVGVLAVGLIAVAILSHSSLAGGGLASNPDLDPGTSLSQPAADFTLTDQPGAACVAAVLPRTGGALGVPRF